MVVYTDIGTSVHLKQLNSRTFKYQFPLIFNMIELNKSFDVAFINLTPSKTHPPTMSQV